VIDALDLIMPLLRRTDEEMHAHVAKAGVPPFYAVSWLLTWHVHGLAEAGARAKNGDGGGRGAKGEDGGDKAAAGEREDNGGEEDGTGGGRDAPREASEARGEFGGETGSGVDEGAGPIGVGEAGVDERAGPIGVGEAGGGGAIRRRRVSSGTAAAAVKSQQALAYASRLFDAFMVRPLAFLWSSPRTSWSWLSRICSFRPNYSLIVCPYTQHVISPQRRACAPSAMITLQSYAHTHGM